MSEIKVKAFVAALSNFDNNLSDLKKYLNDKRITQAEKKILEAWILLGDNKVNQILDTIPYLVTGYDELVEAQKQLIWGIALNNKTEFQEAKVHIEASIAPLVKYSLSYHTFIAYYNYFILNFNLNDAKGMEYCLDHMDSQENLSAKQRLIFNQCQFTYFSFTNQNSKASKILNAIDKRRSEMTGVMLVSHLITTICYYVKLERYDKCMEILLDLKNLKKFATSSSYRFMHLLLSHLHEDAPIYAYERDFSDYPYLYHQIMVVKLLEENRPTEAQVFWKKLQSSMPHLYADDFVYKGEKCLFSLVIQKHKRDNKDVTRQLSSNKEIAIIQVLEKLKTPLDKEQLYFRIYGEKPADKFDMGKMQRMISRLRNKGYEINYRKSCYLLETAKKKVS